MLVILIEISLYEKPVPHFSCDGQGNVMSGFFTHYTVSCCPIAAVAGSKV